MVQGPHPRACVASAAGFCPAPYIAPSRRGCSWPLCAGGAFGACALSAAAFCRGGGACCCRAASGTAGGAGAGAWRGMVGAGGALRRGVKGGGGGRLWGASRARVTWLGLSGQKRDVVRRT